MHTCEVIKACALPEVVLCIEEHLRTEQMLLQLTSNEGSD